MLLQSKSSKNLEIPVLMSGSTTRSSLFLRQRRRTGAGCAAGDWVGKKMSDVRAKLIYFGIGKPGNAITIIIIMNIIQAGKIWGYYVWN